MDEQELILGQYKVYSEAKENFIDRHFATNRFYFVFSFTLLVAAYLFHALAALVLPVIVTATFGLAVSFLWWLNIDSYQVLIKIKYAKILEYLETKLPETPYKKEFEEANRLNRAKTLTFPDVQKIFAGLLFFSFLVMLVVASVSLINNRNGGII